MTDPGRSSGKDSEQILAEALRARAGGNPALGRQKGAAAPTGSGGGGRPVAHRQPLTLTQLILSSLIAGMAVGILIALLTLL